MSKSNKKRMVRCRHRLANGKLCNVPLCKIDGRRITVRRKGREVSFSFFPDQVICIRCERCGNETRIGMELQN